MGIFEGSRTTAGGERLHFGALGCDAMKAYSRVQTPSQAVNVHSLVATGHCSSVQDKEVASALLRCSSLHGREVLPPTLLRLMLRQQVVTQFVRTCLDTLFRPTAGPVRNFQVRLRAVSSRLQPTTCCLHKGWLPDSPASSLPVRSKAVPKIGYSCQFMITIGGSILGS